MNSAIASVTHVWRLGHRSSKVGNSANLEKCDV